MAAGCTCIVSLEVLMGPHTGLSVGPMPIADGPICIGRSKKFVGAGLLLASDFDVSSKHARLEAGTGRIALTDVGSTNGTKVNDKPIAPRVGVPLSDGDTITTGGSLLAFRVEACCSSCEASKAHPPIIAQVSPPPEPEECVVCHRSLYGLSFEERHVHVNQCLDEQPQAKKAKKTKSIDQQQVDLALALSKSLVDDDLEASVTKTMLTRELESLDAQIHALQKQRAKVLRQLAKSNKQARKVAKSRVLPPSDVLAQTHETPSAWAFLFPPQTPPPSRPPHVTASCWLKAAQGAHLTIADFTVACVLALEAPCHEVETFDPETSGSQPPRASHLLMATDPAAAPDAPPEIAGSSLTASADPCEPSIPLPVEPSPNGAASCEAQPPVPAASSPESLSPNESSPAAPSSDVPVPDPPLPPADIADIFPQWQDDVAFVAAQTDTAALTTALAALRATLAESNAPSVAAALAFFEAHMVAHLQALAHPI
ncbi:hypothetical protein ACHHYP_03127 [Achlya hypogyna]|uniref:FHA domain-containing protein n=1 Tax=Achlya hypogyna TaxID=1202772 RepID=A0A1V9Z4I0_ACHHY|nr:hypothetical protein ACHHYP_03127 [Achlya hypogyna]